VFVKYEGWPEAVFVEEYIWLKAVPIVRPKAARNQLLDEGRNLVEGRVR
jgi:hypothetical protein